MILKRFAASLIIWILLYPVSSGQGIDGTGDSARSDNDIQLLGGNMTADSAAVLEVPNVFTPNGDGTNDYFTVATDGTTIYAFSIFTRTGMRIYFTRSPRIFWDGRSINGLEYPAGVYYYVIEESGPEDPETKAGFIHLFR